MPEGSSPFFREQLSRLEELLREKKEKYSTILKTVEEQKDARKRRKETKDAEGERLRQQLAQIVLEQEAERNQQKEASAADEVVSSDLLSELEEINRERLAGLTSYVQECRDVQQEHHEQLIAAIRDLRA